MWSRGSVKTIRQQDSSRRFVERVRQDGRVGQESSSRSLVKTEGPIKSVRRDGQVGQEHDPKGFVKRAYLFATCLY